MCLFRYREKRYGKFTMILVSLLMVALAVAAVWGGIYAFTHITMWAKYLLLVLGIIVGLAVGGFGLFMFFIALSMSGKSKSVRDINKTKGTAGTRLCEVCGRVISKKAEFCEHCGDRQESMADYKICPKCKSKNNATADFCQKCGEKF